jgi:ABC-2 type transport system permease protein
MTPRRIFEAYLTEARLDCLRVLRTPGFLVPLLVLPVGFYVLFGVVIAGTREGRPGGPSEAFIFVSFLVYGILAPGLIGIGGLLASDRGQRILEYKRALPMPSASYIVAKLAMAVVLSGVVVAAMMAIAAAFGTVNLRADQLLYLAGIMVLGVAPVSALGLFIATYASSTAAGAISSMLMVAMAILAGLFYPLPPFLWTLRPVWPTYHLQQLGLAAAGELSSGAASGHVAVLTGMTLVFASLAAHRLARAG